MTLRIKFIPKIVVLIMYILGRGASCDRTKRHRKEAWTRHERECRNE